MSHFKKSLTLCVLTLLPVVVFAQTCQTASIPATTPTNRFTVNNNGTVSDTKTGLMWKKCSEGQSGTDCSGGSATTYTWQLALQQAQTINNGGGFAGYSDWRVPNVKELVSITEKQCTEPAINLTVFPNTPSNWFWSSSPTASHSDGAWYVTTTDGYSSYYGKSYSSNVRLVRG
ncbi:MAG: DUF1566 domain-containing protein [Methylococcaceae bacterium]